MKRLSPKTTIFLVSAVLTCLNAQCQLVHATSFARQPTGQPSHDERQELERIWDKFVRVNQVWLGPAPKQLHYTAIGTAPDISLVNRVWINHDLIHWKMHFKAESDLKRETRCTLIIDGEQERYVDGWEVGTYPDPFGDGSDATEKKTEIDEKLKRSRPTRDASRFRQGLIWNSAVHHFAKRGLPESCRLVSIPGGAADRTNRLVVLEMVHPPVGCQIGLGLYRITLGNTNNRFRRTRLHIKLPEHVPVLEELFAEADDSEPTVRIEYGSEYYTLNQSRAPKTIRYLTELPAVATEDVQARPWDFSVEFQLFADQWLLEKATNTIDGELKTQMTVSEVSADPIPMALFDYQQQVDETRDPEIRNGSFEKWQGGVPIDWTVEIGARHGADEPLSSIRKAIGPSLELSGNGATMAWRSVSQKFPVEPATWYRLRFLAKANDVKREGRQYDNCFVGVFLIDSAGKTVSRLVENIDAAEYRDGKVLFRVSRDVTRAQAVIFLSQSGALNVKQVSIEKLGETDSFQILVEDMDRYYSYFKHKNIDWKSLTEQYRDRAESADGVDEFADVVLEMLSELKDVHIWINRNGRQVSKYRSGYKANFDFPVIDKELNEVKTFGRLGSVGRTPEGFGYVRVNSLTVNQETVTEMISEIEKLFDAPGIILDLRANGGGAEGLASQIAALFADEKRVYARSKFRSGPNHDDFVEANPRTIGPRMGNTYTKPVVCLIGPGCVSSAEGFAMMMACLPHVTMMGQPTRGASGNPRPVRLPNGLEVFYSRWMSLMPDGSPIEDAGVPPDVEVEPGAGDKTYQRAKEKLKSLVGK